MALGDQPPAEKPEHPPVPRFIISTDFLPERDRAAFFQEELSRLRNTEVVPLSEQAPRYTMDFLAAGPIGISDLLLSPTHFVRSRRHLNDGDGNFTFVLLDRGSQELTHNGHVTAVDSGGCYLMHNAIPAASIFPVPLAAVKAIRVDANALGALVRHPEQAAGRSMAGAGSALALLRGYMQAFTAARNTLSAQVLQSFGLHVIDLIASIIGTTRDGAAQAEAGGVKAARLREVLSAIALRACDPDFHVEVAAGQLAITSRYINRLLEETGHTFSEHVVEHRLRRAWRLLSDPNCTLKVASIAFDCGFNDLSSFNRAFRRRFGETPTAVRGAARADVPGLARSTSSVGELVAAITPFVGAAGSPMHQGR